MTREEELEKQLAEQAIYVSVLELATQIGPSEAVREEARQLYAAKRELERWAKAVAQLSRGVQSIITELQRVEQVSTADVVSMMHGALQEFRTNIQP